jgi:hypothetical protein
MTETPTVIGGSGAIRSENGNSAVTCAADFLYLTAAPTFATMALLTCILGGGSADALCSIWGTSPLSGMFPMYLLMGAFHTAPWLKLISSRGGGAHRSRS